MLDIPFECEFCGEHFPSMAARRSYHKKAMKDCEKMYIWQSQMSRRMNRRSHPNGKQIRKEEIVPPVPKRTEKIANILSRKPKYCCASCGKIFSTESKLNLHKEKNHGQFTCSECRLGHVTKEMLASHISKCHKTFPCPECKTTYTRKDNLKRHMETHQKKFEICTECDKRFASRANLQRHTRNIHSGGMETQLKGKCEPDNDNNTDKVKETEALDADEIDIRTNPFSILDGEKPMDIIEELEEFPLLEPEDMEEIFSEFGLTTEEIIEQVFMEEARYFALSQNALHKI